MNLLLVGCGKMGGAMLSCWLKLDLFKNVFVIEPVNAQGSWDEPVQFLKNAADIPSAFTPDVVIFAVKPQTLPDIIADYRRFKGALFISIAAGKNLDFFSTHLGHDQAIVRAMPNTPASIGQGATAAVANQNVSTAQRAVTEKILSATGTFCWVKDENLMNAVTALSGSGPAYVFLLIECMTAAGIELGLPPEVAEQLARQTVIGAGALAAHEPHTSATTLRTNVTSPGGTTEAALKILMADQDGLQKLISRALTAARDRGVELSV